MDKKKDVKSKEKKQDKIEKYEKPTLVRYSQMRGIHLVAGLATF